MPEDTVCSQPSTCPYTLKPLPSPPAPCLPQAPSCCCSSWLANGPCQAQPHSYSPSLLFALHLFLLLHELVFLWGAALHPTALHLSRGAPAQPPLSSSSFFSFSHEERRSFHLLAFFLFILGCGRFPPWSPVLFQHPSLAGPGQCRQHHLEMQAAARLECPGPCYVKVCGYNWSVGFVWATM